MSFNNKTEAAAGQALEIHAYFNVPLTTDVSSAIVRWKLIDQTQIEYLNGVATSFSSSLAQMQQLDYWTNISLPSDIPTSEVGTTYAFYWELELNGTVFSTAQYPIKIIPVIQDIVGGKDTFYFYGKPITARAVLPTDDDATMTVYYTDTAMYDEIVTAGAPTSQGFNFEHTLGALDPVPPAGLDPYLVTWEQTTFITTSKFWVINPTIAKASSSLLHGINRLNLKARLPDLDFGQTDLLQWLKEGRDKFNAIGLVSNFNMIHANGGIYDLWVECAKVAMLRSQFMTEALHSFQFSGQSTQLDVDLTQYYSSMADTIENGLQTNLTSMKRQLARKGLTGGDGAYYGGPGNVGAVGVAASYPNTRGIMGTALVFRRIRP